MSGKQFVRMALESAVVRNFRNRSLKGPFGKQVKPEVIFFRQSDSYRASLNIAQQYLKEDEFNKLEDGILRGIPAMC